MPILPLFPASIYPALPGLLKDVTDLMHTDQEKSLVLIGSIVTLSSAMVPVMTIYFGKTIYPNMYLFVPGPAGAGKGKLDFCFRLVKPIHKEKLDRWNTAKEEYKKEYARYKRQKKGENIDPPQKPPIQLLRVPANSSSTSFQQAMAENGNLLMFETEGDTVVNAPQGFRTREFRLPAPRGRRRRARDRQPQAGHRTVWHAGASEIADTRF